MKPQDAKNTKRTVPVVLRMREAGFTEADCIYQHTRVKGPYNLTQDEFLRREKTRRDVTQNEVSIDMKNKNIGINFKDNKPIDKKSILI
jgi:hypothetical protein